MATGGGSRYVGPTVQATIREQASATASDHDGTSARREAVTAGLVAAGDWVSVIAVVPGRKWWLRSTSPARLPPAATGRSEERRVGKGCVSTFRSRWSPYPLKKKTKQKK